MLDAIYISDIDPKGVLRNTGSDTQQITFSIFEFKILSAQKIALYRHSLFCPECLQVAYFRRVSKDGKQACFGSRHHLPNCSELKSSNKTLFNKKSPIKALAIVKSEEKSKPLDVLPQNVLSQGDIFQDGTYEKIIDHKTDMVTAAENGFIIDFTARNKVSKNKPNSTYRDKYKAKILEQKVQAESDPRLLDEKEPDRTIKQTLPKLLKSLLNNSSLATSDVWVFTSEKHKWRAKNLFVKLSDAQALENFAPRMYWGTISYADKELLWLNVADAKNVAIPIKLFQQEFLNKYSIEESADLTGANIILFAKCLSNKDQSRQFLQLWSNDLQYLHLSLAAQGDSKVTTKT